MMATIIDMQAARGRLKSAPRSRKTVGTAALFDAISAAASSANDATDETWRKLRRIGFEREAQVAIPRSIFAALLADSRALAAVQRELTAHNDRMPADLRQDVINATLADAAEWAEQWAVRLPRRRRSQRRKVA